MLVSKELFWFQNVELDQGLKVDCLVDVTKQEAEEGYLLIADGNKLKMLKASSQEREYELKSYFCILGKVKRYDSQLF
ncbi:MAG: hypothetical protein U1E78_11845 [Gammaproteobacteria bacterium]